jgi:hypothetical protein
MIKLTDKEREFLRRLLAEHRTYYDLLSMHPKCSQTNRDQRLFIDTLWQKLSRIYIAGPGMDAPKE